MRCERKMPGAICPDGGGGWGIRIPVIYEHLFEADFRCIYREETDTSLDPDDPVVEERGVVNAETEQQAIMFWKELNAEERTKMMAAVKELWGREGAALLPISLRQQCTKGAGGDLTIISNHSLIESQSGFRSSPSGVWTRNFASSLNACRSRALASSSSPSWHS
jgi:hypothetical protein